MARPKPETPRVRLSLECSAETKAAIESHGADLGERSTIGAIRESVRRSAVILEAQRRGTLLIEIGDEFVEVEGLDLP